MSPKLTMCRGLPGCGKSTWAHGQGYMSDGQAVRVEKDLLRDMLHFGEWSKSNEKAVLVARDALVSALLGAGKNVIVSDTNLEPFHETRLREIADQHKASFHIEDFTHVPVEECIRRDLLREKSVGEQVIRKMWRRHLFKATHPEQRPKRDGFPQAAVFDLDGTLALMGERSPYDASMCEHDIPNWPVIQVLHDYVAAREVAGDVYAIIFCSGRSVKYRAETLAWLEKHVLSGLPDHTATRLYMRPEWMTDPRSGKQVPDHRKDSIVKTEIFNTYIDPVWDVDVVYDDRDQVVGAWRALGLTTCQVAPGDF